MNKFQKRRVRQRLRRVEDNVNLLNALGTPCRALDTVNQEPLFSQMTAEERYTYFSRKFDHRKRIPLHHHASWTKVHIPRGLPHWFYRRPENEEPRAKEAEDIKVKNRIPLAKSA